MYIVRRPDDPEDLWLVLPERTECDSWIHTNFNSTIKSALYEICENCKNEKGRLEIHNADESIWMIIEKIPDNEVPENAGSRYRQKEKEEEQDGGKG